MSLDETEAHGHPILSTAYAKGAVLLAAARQYTAEAVDFKRGKFALARDRFQAVLLLPDGEKTNLKLLRPQGRAAAAGRLGLLLTLGRSEHSPPRV